MELGVRRVKVVMRRCRNDGCGYERGRVGSDADADQVPKWTGSRVRERAEFHYGPIRERWV